MLFFLFSAWEHGGANRKGGINILTMSLLPFDGLTSMM